ncbi:hypothetical protein KP79_PYT07482 [Mizuhopecten yessoensis]|uniref:Uncharacterized protein n=1 Tax=Mizuhopecten yessoensis TaxID=6573 RepID=A0A210QQF7_MIZYE|nr:hypothetical protein KP79_PYT07482 [Mizuhopecten yessoensis]
MTLGPATMFHACQEYLLLGKFDKCLSLPVDSSSLSLEITVLNNYLLLQSLRCAGHPTGVVDSCGNHVHRTLLRVIKHIGSDEDSDSTCTLKTDNESLFDIIFRRHTLSESPVNLTCIVSLFCIWSVLMRVTGDISKAMSCLSSCPLYFLDSVEADQSRGLFEIPFSLMLTSKTACGTDSETSQADKVRLLRGMFMFCIPDKREQSKLDLQEVIGTHLHPYTKYMLACLEYESGQYLDAIMLCSQASNTSVDSVKLRALHSSLLGACFSKLGKHHCAIEKYKEALTLDFTYLWPLYSLSLEYQSLGLHDPELESLNLLITALESEQRKERPSLLHQCLCPGHQQITLLQAQYRLAERCLQLHKFDAAYQRYLDVLSCLHHVENFKTGGSSEVRLPSVLQMYQEAEYSLLRAKQYTDCVLVCDKVLSCDAPSQGLSGYHSDQSQDQSILSSQTCSHGAQSLNVPSVVSGSQQRKRLRSHSGELSATIAKEDTRSMLYKADALIHMGQLDSATNCLERSLEPLSSLTIDSNTLSSQDTDAGSQPYSKRKRIDSDGTAVPCRSSPHSGGCPLLSIRHTAAQVYNHLGVAKSRCQNYKDALHYIRLSLQLYPYNDTVMYNLTAVLRSLQRQREGVTNWTKYRRLGAGSDSLQLANVLRRKKQQLRSLDTEVDIETDQGSMELVWDSVSDQQMLELDIECLEALIRTR